MTVVSPVSGARQCSYLETLNIWNYVENKFETPKKPELITLLQVHVGAHRVLFREFPQLYSI